MSRKRHGTAQRAIPKVPRGEFAIEERTLVDLAGSARIAQTRPTRERAIPSITKPRAADSSTPPPNVIPFTKPRAIAALAASNPNALVIEESASKALRGFDNTTSIQSRSTAEQELTRPVAPVQPAGATRVATGWTPPGAVPTAPVRTAPTSVPVGAQTLYPMPAPQHVPGPVKGTVVPVPPLHIAQSGGLALALPPLHAPAIQPARVVAAPVPVAAPVAKPSAPAWDTSSAPAWDASPSAPAWDAKPSAPAWDARPSAPVAKPSVPVAKPSAPAWPPVPQAPATPPKVEPTVAAPALAAPAMPFGAAPLAYPVALTPPEPEVIVAEPANKWAVFERLGLGAPKKILQNPQKLIVNIYKLLGFGILSIIVFVLIGYIANTAFFYLSSSWVVPMVVAPTDEKVVSLQAQLAEQQNTRDRINDELNQAERSIAAQQAFQLEFAKAIKSDLEGRKAALGRVRELANTAAATRAAIKHQNSAYASASRRRMQQEYAAGLIDRNAMLSGKFQLAQITSSNLSLAERQAEFETRASELEAETRSLDAILANVDGTDTALSYEVLRIKQEYAASRLDLAKSIETRNTLRSSLGRQDKIVTSLKRSAYLRAVADGASVAFVPYGNLSHVDKGTDVYACKLGMVFCYHVGEVLEVLPGEVQFKHPHRDRMLRGQMVEMKLDEDDADAAAGDVLFVGGKPLLI